MMSDLMTDEQAKAIDDYKQAKLARDETKAKLHGMEHEIGRLRERLDHENDEHERTLAVMAEALTK